MLLGPLLEAPFVMAFRVPRRASVLVLVSLLASLTLTSRKTDDPTAFQIRLKGIAASTMAFRPTVTPLYGLAQTSGPRHGRTSNANRPLPPPKALAPFGGIVALGAGLPSAARSAGYEQSTKRRWYHQGEPSRLGLPGWIRIFSPLVCIRDR
jgi:hypothetical protein